MSDIPKGLAPARYIGGHAVELGPGQRYYNIDGTPRRSRMLEHGDELLMRDEDVHGKTLWHDPHYSLPSIKVGLGRVVMPQHAGLSNEELALIGYEWHMGRSDVEALEPIADTAPAHEVLADSAVASQVVAPDGEARIIESPVETAKAAESENS